MNKPPTLEPGLVPAATESEAREQLAALYRLYVHFGWTDLIYTHASARVPGEPDHYLIKPDELLLDEVTADSLVKMDMQGNRVSGDFPPNLAGHLIHSAVLQARPDVTFAAHTHSRAGVAVSAMKCGLLPISQHSNSILPTVCYHDYEDVTQVEDECAALARDIADNHLMIMRNHGLLSVGRTVAECFYYLYFLEMSCKIQVDVLSSGEEPILVSDRIVQQLFRDGGVPESQPPGVRVWLSMMRMLDRKGIDYRG
jgi:ribulose-5-phosphate 4-epimerase/fuculose-1-phosphate aldolase